MRGMRHERHHWHSTGAGCAEKHFAAGYNLTPAAAELLISLAVATGMQFLWTPPRSQLMEEKSFGGTG